MYYRLLSLIVFTSLSVAAMAANIGQSEVGIPKMASPIPYGNAPPSYQEEVNKKIAEATRQGLEEAEQAAKQYIHQVSTGVQGPSKQDMPADYRQAQQSILQDLKQQIAEQKQRQQATDKLNNTLKMVNQGNPNVDNTRSYGDESYGISGAVNRMFLSFGIFVILLITCFIAIKKLGLKRAREYLGKEKLIQLLQKFLIALKETRGVKRLYVAMSILYLIVLIGVVFADISYVSLCKSSQLLFFGGMPVWLNWFAYWIYLDFKSTNRGSKLQFWPTIVFILVVIMVFSAGYSDIFIIVSLPVWLSWLTYWVYLGFKRDV